MIIKRWNHVISSILCLFDVVIPFARRGALRQNLLLARFVDRMITWRGNISEIEFHPWASLRNSNSISTKSLSRCSKCDVMNVTSSRMAGWPVYTSLLFFFISSTIHNIDNFCVLLMRATFAGGPTFRDLISVLKETLTDATFECTPEHLKLHCMDSTNISLTALSLPQAYFLGDDGYACEIPFCFSVSLVHLEKIAKALAIPDTTLTITVEKDADHMKVFATKVPTGGVVGEFHLKLMDISSEAFRMPEVTFRGIARMQAAAFKEHLTTLLLVGDKVTIQIDQEAVVFSATGDIGDGMQKVYADKKTCVTKLIDCEKAEAKYSGFFLRKFSVAAKISKQVILMICDTGVIEVKFRISMGEAEEGSEYGALSFFLAPIYADE